MLQHVLEFPFSSKLNSRMYVTHFVYPFIISGHHQLFPAAIFMDPKLTKRTSAIRLPPTPRGECVGTTLNP